MFLFYNNNYDSFCLLYRVGVSLNSTRDRNKSLPVCIYTITNYNHLHPKWISASEMTYIVSSGALNSTHSLTPCAGQYWCKWGPTPRSCDRLATVDWCESQPISQLHLLWSTMLRTTTSTAYKPTWSTRWSSGISGDRILISNVWAASFYPYTHTVRCTAPRLFQRQSSWRRNTVWSTSKTMTRNASFGACCPRYIHPLTIHIA